MFKKPIIFIECLFVIFSPYLLHAQNKLDKKKLIEFGWDYPNVSFLKSHITSMEKMPFDGVVFSFDFDIYNAFDTTQFADSKFQFNDLSKIQWKKFTDNFLFVRGAGLSGPHWLDDNSWIKITRNLKNISKVLAISKAKGIGFDPEFYFNNPKLNPWTYSPSLYNNLSYQEVGNYVRKRGKQFMQALQTEKPDVKILCFWLLGLVSEQTQSLPIDQTGMALYPFFVEGMLEGKNKSSEIIDGNESSYWYKTPESFVTSGEYLRDNGSKLIKKSLQSKFKEVSLAQSVYFDGIYGKLPGTEKHFDKQPSEQWLGENLYNAYKTTDKYVWFYNEKINWWKNQVESGVPEIINEVRNQINSEQNDTALGLSEKTFRKQSDNFRSFDYNYLKSRNILQINLLNIAIQYLQLYENSRLIYNINNPAMNFSIDLNKKYTKNGNLIIIAKDRKGKTSVLYVN